VSSRVACQCWARGAEFVASVAVACWLGIVPEGGATKLCKANAACNYALMRNVGGQVTLPAPFAPLAIGLAVVVGAFAAGPFTGGAMNPARALGPAIAFWNFKNIWVYLLANFMGGMSGAVIYENLFLEVCSPAPSSSVVRSGLCRWRVSCMRARLHVKGTKFAVVRGPADELQHADAAARAARGQRSLGVNARSRRSPSAGRASVDA
jgi:hypothetical protein